MEANQLTTEIIETDYFKKPGVSNSFLGDVNNLINGRSLFKCSQDTLDFGSQLHEAILEPQPYLIKLPTAAYQINKHKVLEMTKKAVENNLLGLFLNDPKTKFEQEIFFNTMEVNCKLKADIICGKVVGDLKTTDARTREEFQARAIEYGYNRQGAFYLDGTGCKRFIIFAIAKKYPHPTFTYVLEHNSPELIEGREQYQYLIEEYKKLSPEQLELLKRK